MSKQRLFDDLSAFFDDVPDVVRAELSLLLVVLNDDHAVETEGWADCEHAARPLFNATGRFGRFGDLIKAVSVFDVYFATDARERLEPSVYGTHSGTHGRKAANAMNHRFADRLAAIEQARADWQTLRQSRLSPAAISAALLPPFVQSPRPASISQLRRTYPGGHGAP